METKKNQYDLSLPFSINSYINSLLQHVNNSTLPDNIFQDSKNHIVVISNTGHFKKTSNSFFNLLGYSDIELLSISVKGVVVEGDFIFDNKATSYYFTNTICGPNKKSKKVKWRLIPDVMEDAYVFVGWEIKP